MKSKMSIVSNNLYLIKKLLRLNPLYLFIRLFSDIITGLFSAVQLYFTVLLFNSFNNHFSITSMISIIVVLASTNLVFGVMKKALSEYLIPIFAKRTENNFKKEIYEKARTVDLECYDNTDFYDSLAWTITESYSTINEILNNISFIISLTISSVATFAILSKISPIVSVVLFVNAIGTLCIQLASARNWMKENEALVPLSRKIDYANRVFFDSKYAPIMRVSNIKTVIHTSFKETYEKMISTKKRYGLRKFIYWGIFGNIFDQIAYFGTLFILISGLKNGTILLGGFVGTMNAVWDVKYMLSDFVYYFTDFYTNSLKIDKIISFFEYKNKINNGVVEFENFNSLEFKNVSFSYDVDKEEVLRKVNLFIHKGEHIALVGCNGSGKSTIIKLLMRLYDPNSGEILLNDNSLKKYRLDTYHERIGVVFQDYNLFSATIGENIVCKECFEDNQSDIYTSLKKVNFSGFSELKHGINTMIGREFDENGLSLSGGESQKVVLARALIINKDLIIMDEPSSSLDPESEWKLNQLIERETKEKTLILISHRLTTTRCVDKIYVVDHGSIIESGSHKDLICKNGVYAKMFKMQSDKYL